MFLEEFFLKKVCFENSQQTTEKHKKSPSIQRVDEELCYSYSKTCLKRSLKIGKTKILMTNGSFMKVEVLQNAPIGAFCNTFDLH